MRLSVPALVVGAVALLAVAAPSAASARDYKGFVGLLGEPTHEASQGAGWTANFVEKKPGGVRYRVCLKHRDAPKVKKCWSKNTGANGRSEIFVALFVNDEGGPGDWIAKWFVDGRKVDKWKFEVRPEFE
jgi:hypothetical protein